MRKLRSIHLKIDMRTVFLKQSELRSRSIFGGSGSGSDPLKILRLRLLAPAPGQFQKAINQKIVVRIFFIKNEKKINDSLAWTEHLLKGKLNLFTYFEKICWL